MNIDARHSLYRERVLAALPRLLTELDRDRLSTTYGSFDREYWAWATKDFSNVDLQRAIYPLTALYLHPIEGNGWYKQGRVRDWILGAVEFWRKSQHRNGSFDHHYPNEFSFVGAAFPLFEIGEAFCLLDLAGELGGSERSAWIAVMQRAGDFLCRSDEEHGFISNHRIGAACGLVRLAGLTQKDRYRQRAQSLIESVKSRRSHSEGWLHEYGGADPGYQTLDTYYLANYWTLTGDREFYDEVVAPSVRFLTYFFPPDGSVGGEHGSRNCPLYFPSGFEVLAKTLPDAEAIAALGAEGIRSGATPALGDMDIRNFVPMLSSYAQAMLVSSAGRPVSASQLPCRREFERYWPEAGLFVRSDRRHYSIVGGAKGGVVKIFRKVDGRMLASHAGYMIETDGGASLSNQFLAEPTVQGVEDCAGRETPVQETRILRLSHPFFAVLRTRVFTPWRFLLFRLFALTVGRNIRLANWVKRTIITGWFINRRRASPVGLERQIRLGSEDVTIEDRFTGLDPGRLKTLTAGDLFTTIYMASSKYYRRQECLPETLNPVDLAAVVRQEPTLCFRLTDEGLRLDRKDPSCAASSVGSGHAR